MWVRYDAETDTLTIRLDAGQHEFRNELHQSDDLEVVFDIDAGDRVAGIDILDASRRVNLAALLPLGSRNLRPVSPERALRSLPLRRGRYTGVMTTQLRSWPPPATSCVGVWRPADARGVSSPLFAAAGHQEGRGLVQRSRVRALAHPALLSMETCMACWSKSLGSTAALIGRPEHQQRRAFLLDEGSELQPDVIVPLRGQARRRLPRRRRPLRNWRAELVAEIAASSASYDLHDKKDAYREAGSPGVCRLARQRRGQSIGGGSMPASTCQSRLVRMAAPTALYSPVCARPPRPSAGGPPHAARMSWAGLGRCAPLASPPTALHDSRRIRITWRDPPWLP